MVYFCFINSSNTAFTALTPNENFDLDSTRLTICTAKTGISGHQILKKLDNEFNIVCEMADDRNIVCIMTGIDSKYDFEQLKNAFLACSAGLTDDIFPDIIPNLPEPKQAISIRKSWFSKNKTINIISFS